MYDECMKIMFLNPEHLEPITLLLSKILEVKYEDIEGKVQIKDSRVPNKTLGDKKTDRDIVVYINTKPINKIVIEINLRNKLYQSLIDRNIYYMEGLFGRGLKEIDDYSNISPTFLINLNNFYVDMYHEDILDYYYFRNKHGYILTEKQKILNINIAACKEIWYNKTYKEIKNDREKDLILLCAALTLDDIDDFNKCIDEIKIKSKIKNLMKEVSEVMNDNDDLYERYYDFMEENKRINASIISEEKANARKEGLEEGHQEGHQEGLLEGKKLGYLENQKNIVLNMYKNKFSLEQIKLATDLSVDEIKRLLILK